MTVVASTVFVMCTIGSIAVVAVLVLLPLVGSVVPLGGATVAVLLSIAALLDDVVPVIVMTTAPPGGSVGTVPLTVLPATLTDPGHTAPPLAPPQLALTPLMAAGTPSLKLVPSASDGP